MARTIPVILDFLARFIGLGDVGAQVLVVTHSLTYLDVCDQVLLLAPGGKMAFCGPPAQIGNKAVNSRGRLPSVSPLVATITGSKTMGTSFSSGECA